MGICSVCGKDKMRMSRKRVPALCHDCYMKSYHKTYERKLDICSLCGEKRRIECRNLEGCPICDRCYCQPHKRCTNCGSMGEIETNHNDMPLCRKCYKEPKHQCSICGKERDAASVVSGDFVCKSCYKNQDICTICKEYRTIYRRTESGEPICAKCGSRKEVCGGCSKVRRIHKADGNKRLCHSCYVMWRYHNDSGFAMRMRLRALLRHALMEYTCTGKVCSSKMYGVDYDAIIQHLGPCPGDMSDYSIDHILPLSVFDLNDLSQVTIAFAPENHRWCPNQENLEKNAKFDPKVLEAYLERWR